MTRIGFQHLVRTLEELTRGQGSCDTCTHKSGYAGPGHCYMFEQEQKPCAQYTISVKRLLKKTAEDPCWLGPSRVTQHQKSELGESCCKLLLGLLVWVGWSLRKRSH